MTVKSPVCRFCISGISRFLVSPPSHPPVKLLNEYDVYHLVIADFMAVAVQFFQYGAEGFLLFLVRTVILPLIECIHCFQREFGMPESLFEKLDTFEISG